VLQVHAAGDLRAVVARSWLAPLSACGVGERACVPSHVWRWRLK
jgi:hypothetical protein